MSSAGELKRLVRQLDAKIKDEEFYDAHQLVRAVFERFAKKADLQGAIEFAEQYAGTFAEHDQFELCINLGQRVLTLMKKMGERPSEENVNKLTLLFLLCPPNSTESKYEFMNDVVVWVREAAKSQNKGDSPVEKDLQSLLADAYLAEGKFGACQNHLVYCDDVDRLVTLITKWESAGYPSEKYFYALRLALILLHRQKLELASEFLLKYAEQACINLDSVDCPPPIQVAYLTLAACKYNSLELYETIGRKYVLILRMDDCIGRIFQLLETSVFKIKRQDNFLMGMLNQMMAGGAPAITASR